jgi:hypothetical protein
MLKTHLSYTPYILLQNNVREAAGELLAACLDILTSKERERDQDLGPSKTGVLRKLIDDISINAHQTNPIHIHGALWAYRMLLLHGGPVGVPSREFEKSSKVYEVHARILHSNR